MALLRQFERGARAVSFSETVRPNGEALAYDE
jgi:hypothetical protein